MQGLRDQQGFDQDRGMRMSQRMFPAVNGGGLHQGQAANSLQLLQQQQMRQQLENQIAQALSNAAVQVALGTTILSMMFRNCKHATANT